MGENVTMPPAVNTEVRIGRMLLRNPVTVASGTFGYASEFSGFLDLRELGAVTTKTITLRPRRGNPPPRTCETPAGMLNSVGLENPGIDVFLRDKLPYIAGYKVPVIVSIASESGNREFVELAGRLDRCRDAAAIELNISCPNLRHKTESKGAYLIAQDARATYRLVKAVRAATKKTIITKLSPNVTDIGTIAEAAEAAGSDALSMINTISGMSIDIESRRPKIGAVVGGLSGPAIRPVAVRMVWETSKRVRIPIIGMGGIGDTSDALEFIMAGASAVGVGTGNFLRPSAAAGIARGIKEYLRLHRIGNINALRKGLKYAR